MATLNYLNNGDVVTANDWNAHVDQINENTEAISSAGSVLSNLVTESQTYATRTSAVLMHRYATAAQTIPNTTWTKMVVNQGVTSTGKITVSNNNTFTVNAAGVYQISAAARFDVNTEGARNIVISNGTDSGERWGGCTVPGGQGFFTPTATAVRYLPAGATIAVYVFQDTGGPLNLVPSGQINHVSIAYLGEA